MNDSKRWRTMMKRLAWLRAEAQEAVESFEESVKDIEDKIKAGAEGDDHAAGAQSASKEIITMKDVVIDEASPEWKERKKAYEPPPPPKDVPPAEKNVQVEEDKKEDELKPHYKRLWRVVARLTHPDVSGNDPEMTALYKAAVEAYEKDKRAELLDVASEVNAQLDGPHPRMFEDLSGRCIHYENLIKKLRSSVAWQWKDASEQSKSEIVKLIRERREKKKSEGE